MTDTSSLWHNPAYLRFWAADTISVFGSLVTRVALPFTAILALDASAFEVSLLALADLVPSFVVGLPIGVWVDRLKRLPLMIAADLVRAAVLLSIPVAAWLDALTLGQLYAVSFLASALTVLFNVAQVSVLPSLVPRKDLLEANSKTSATQSISEVGAFGISGWLVQLLSGPGAILIDAISFVASAILLKQVKAQEALVEVEQRVGMRQEILEGLQLVGSHPLLRAIALASTALWFGLAIFGTLISLFALRELGFDAGPLAMIFAVGGMSSLLGSVLVQPVTRRLGIGPAMIAGLAISGLLLMPLSVAQGAGLFAVACLVVQQLGDGATLVFMINEVTLRQAIVSQRMIGRVNATNEFLRSLARLLGVLVAGLAGELLGLRVALALGGGIVIAGALFLSLTSLRSVKTLGATPSEASG
ncbi:MAG TPA: MFS transporter [Dehalococcoidia bacterium]|nr:MFS transporter [Dehalococcoidia bacterium]